MDKPEDVVVQRSFNAPEGIVFIDRDFSTLKKNTYRCEAGHTMEIYGNWTTLSVPGDRGNSNYNFCFHCYGEWAQKQWPLTCDEAGVSNEVHMDETTKPEMILVPRTPTNEMIDAAWASALAEDAEGVWKSMVECWIEQAGR